MGFKGVDLAASKGSLSDFFILPFFLNLNVLLFAFQLFSFISPNSCLCPQIEDGGKAALCEKLKVGDELININGSALYGSRQEALILIKGSYRILKLTVRR